MRSGASQQGKPALGGWGPPAVKEEGPPLIWGAPFGLPAAAPQPGQQGTPPAQAPLSSLVPDSPPGGPYAPAASGGSGDLEPYTERRGYSDEPGSPDGDASQASSFGRQQGRRWRQQHGHINKRNGDTGHKRRRTSSTIYTRDRGRQRSRSYSLRPPKYPTSGHYADWGEGPAASGSPGPSPDRSPTCWDEEGWDAGDAAAGSMQRGTNAQHGHRGASAGSEEQAPVPGPHRTKSSAARFKDLRNNRKCGAAPDPFQHNKRCIGDAALVSGLLGGAGIANRAA